MSKYSGVSKGWILCWSVQCSSYAEGVHFQFLFASPKVLVIVPAGVSFVDTGDND
jgi:hypothetical protein